MTKEWNAALYHQISGPQVSWGKKVLSRVELRGNERLLDAGCGTGRLTRDLLEALPRGKVVALDVSQNMIDAARNYLEPDFGGRVEFVCCDLLDLSFENEFDGIFSTASFHWVLDHDRLFRNLYRALKPGGWLIAQCGGGKNIARLLARAERLMATEPYAQSFAGYESPWEYSDAETATTRLKNAGFDQIETNLEEAPTKFANAAEFRSIRRERDSAPPPAKNFRCQRAEAVHDDTHQRICKRPFPIPDRLRAAESEGEAGSQSLVASR